ncbi:MAG: glycosyltransferase, partial [Sphingobacteriales bacterium]
AAYGLKPGGYYMILARMEPENHIEMVIRGYLLSGQRLPLVVIGNINNTYGKELQKKYTEVRFMPGIYETGIVNALRHFSRLYFHGHSVGGTNPSLLEAMACGCTIAAHNNPFNKTVLEDNAFYFSSAEDIAGIVNNTNDAAVNGMIEANQRKIQEHYSWSSIIDSYESLFLRSLQKKD